MRPALALMALLAAPLLLPAVASGESVGIDVPGFRIGDVTQVRSRYTFPNGTIDDQFSYAQRVVGPASPFLDAWGVERRAYPIERDYAPDFVDRFLAEVGTGNILAGSSANAFELGLRFHGATVLPSHLDSAALSFHSYAGSETAFAGRSLVPGDVIEQTLPNHPRSNRTGLYRAVAIGWETVQGERLFRVEGTERDNAVVYWLSPGSPIVVRLQEVWPSGYRFDLEVDAHTPGAGPWLTDPAYAPPAYRAKNPELPRESATRDGPAGAGFASFTLADAVATATADPRFALWLPANPDAYLVGATFADTGDVPRYSLWYGSPAGSLYLSMRGENHMGVVTEFFAFDTVVPAWAGAESIDVACFAAAHEALGERGAAARRTLVAGSWYAAAGLSPRCEVWESWGDGDELEGTSHWMGTRLNAATGAAIELASGTQTNEGIARLG